MIRILDSTLNLQAILQNIETAKRFEEINGANTLDFTAIYDDKTARYVNENNIAELDGDYFDIVYYSKDQANDGTLAIQTQTEHVSYRLNNAEYNMDTFTAIGTPAQVLAQLLAGTPFTVGTVEYTDPVTYSAQTAKSRRQLLMEFVALVGGELDFNQFTVSIVAHRGSTSLKLLTKGKNVKVGSKIYDGRQKDANGNPLVSYTCTPIQLPNTPFSMGDEVLLIQKDLGIQESMRIVRLGVNPYYNVEATIELANFVSSIGDSIYQIQTQKVTADKVYNGTKIGPDEGFVATRSDNKVKSVLNATEGISVQSGDGLGAWENRFYVDTDGNIHLKDAFIDIIKALVEILIDPSVGIKITNNSVDVFYLDVDGKVNLVDMIASGAISGSIITGSDITAINYLKVSSTPNGVGYGNAGFQIGASAYIEHQDVAPAYNSDFRIVVPYGNMTICCSLGLRIMDWGESVFTDLRAANIYMDDALVATQSWAAQKGAAVSTHYHTHTVTVGGPGTYVTDQDVHNHTQS